MIFKVVQEIRTRREYRLEAESKEAASLLLRSPDASAQIVSDTPQDELTWIESETWQLHEEAS